jgi:hypothetical protein
VDGLEQPRKRVTIESSCGTGRGRAAGHWSVEW